MTPTRENTVLQAGWYWYDAEYPEEGSCGPFDTRRDAYLHAIEVYDDEDQLGFFEVKAEQ